LNDYSRSGIPERKNLFKAVLSAGLLAGTLDITAAIIHYIIKTGKNPVTILNYIASGVFGNTAFGDHKWMPLLGLIFHYTIAIIFTAFFFLIYPKWKFLSRNIVLSGLVYGIFVWVVMNLIVVPLSAISRFPSSVLQSVISCLILMFAIGLPAAIMAYRYYFRESTNKE
jgi:hypothetical protein